MATKAEIFEQTDKLYNLLFEAYEIAGNLRDTFSETGGIQRGELKGHCNVIRGQLYDTRQTRGQFLRAITKIEE